MAQTVHIAPLPNAPAVRTVEVSVALSTGDAPKTTSVLVSLASPFAISLGTKVARLLTARMPGLERTELDKTDKPLSDINIVQYRA